MAKEYFSSQTCVMACEREYHQSSKLEEVEQEGIGRTVGVEVEEVRWKRKQWMLRYQGCRTSDPNERKDEKEVAISTGVQAMNLSGG